MLSFEQLLSDNKTSSVTKLSFYDLSDKFAFIPKEISEFKSLKHLNTGSIPVTEDSFKDILELEELEELICSKYESERFPVILMNLQNLRSLFLTNSIIFSLPIELNEWHNLAYLNLGGSKSLTEILGVPPNLTYIHIGQTALKHVPRPVIDLKRLRKLVIIGLDLVKIPDEIFEVSSLISLFISDNKINSISQDIKKLTNLRELVLINNSFDEFPTNITDLKRLISINFRNNYLSSLPEEISKLKYLRDINLSDNCFEEFPTALLTLNLKSLHISNVNYSKRVLKNTIKLIPPEIVNLKRLEELRIDPTYIENVPPEIVSNGYDAIRNFFQSKLEADKEEFLFEAKLVIVGRGNVGKTVLTKKLVNPNYLLEESDTTLGINVLKNPFYTPLDVAGSKINFKLNIWDFGGQEKYDATHQLFITKRSIYLFLTEAREESNYLDFYYWLNTIQLFSDNSPVLIILSKYDERKKSLPESVYREKFDNIVDFIDVSCASGFEHTIERLKAKLNEAISLLPQTKLKLSNKWIDIRNELENLSSTKDYISYNTYLEICANYNLDKTRADFLSQYLHDLGVIIHHQGDLLLSETVFINTDWCVDGMYKVLDSEIVNNGKFTADTLAVLWDEPRFIKKKAELVKLMYQYHLCFELKDNSGFIVPELLPPDKPINLSWDRSLNLKFEYRYEFMPAGILSRFIVKSHSFIKDNNYWKHGVMLEYEGTIALIEEDYIYSKIKISIKGRNKKGLLAAIRMYIEEVHKDFDKANKLNFAEMIPCNCTDCIDNTNPHFYKFNVLKKFEEKLKRTVLCEISGDDVPIRSLIDDVQIASNSGKLCTNQDLKEFIINIIENVLEPEIRYKASYVNFWRDAKLTEPKNEVEVQPFIANTLDNYCRVNGIQLSREVRAANGNVDMLLTTKNDDNEVLKVCLEIKKAHHQDINTAIKTQLPLYMKSEGTDAGIYLVLWLKNSYHKHPSKYPTINSLNDAILINNPDRNKISLKIIDCAKPVSPSKAI